MAAGLLAFIAALVALTLSLADIDNGRITMDWWIIELITNIVLVAIAIGLGPFIKRFGRSYAADVFRANPRTGKSYLVLTDVAYYLIFTSFILFTVTFVPPYEWLNSTGEQLKHEVSRLGGILLIMGVLALAERHRPAGGRTAAVAEQATRRRRACRSRCSAGGHGPHRWWPAARPRHVDRASRAVIGRTPFRLTSPR